ncbi:MAG: glycosyltransferase, partial [Erythrobacter sp.]|nr:glycosyltransferase [Erythrobacter sp.]
RGIPVGIINGRLSERSFKGYRKIRPLLRPTFARLSFACVQDEHYAHRIGAMGVAEDRIEITGTMKWDSISTEPMSEPSQRAQEIANAMGVDLSKPIVVAGSSGPTEEPLFHTSVPEDVQLIIAPRKTERFDEAAKSVLGSVRRSKGEQRQGATRFLLDTIGELSSVYELADIVIMGRSFNDQFGSDPIEPAALGKPVILGPQHSDFMAAVDMLKADNAIRIETRESLADAVQSLLDDPDERAHMGESARTCVRSQQGASGKHTQRLLGLVKDP